MQQIIFRKATIDDVIPVRQMIERRIEYLREKDIHPSWADRDYLNVFPVEYFVGAVEKGSMYVADVGGEVVACATLHDGDFPRWEDDGLAAYYVHNLASDPLYPGLGGDMLAYCERVAEDTGRKALRLDSIKGNAFLENFYKTRGFMFVKKTCDRGFYCTLWEKRVGEK